MVEYRAPISCGSVQVIAKGLGESGNEAFAYWTVELWLCAVAVVPAPRSQRLELCNHGVQVFTELKCARAGRPRRPASCSELAPAARSC
eukprot:jgi/Ulvmu1/7920/UM004_0152.1